MAAIETLDDLRRSGYRSRPVKQEIRDNLVCKLRAGERLFPGIIGYDETVIPQLVNAVLSRHNFILLGLRGLGRVAHTEMEGPQCRLQGSRPSISSVASRRPAARSRAPGDERSRDLARPALS